MDDILDRTIEISNFFLAVSLPVNRKVTSKLRVQVGDLLHPARQPAYEIRDLIEADLKERQVYYLQF